MKQQVIVSGSSGRHLVVRADSKIAEYARSFDLVLTSPPFFHPTRSKRGDGVTAGAGDLDAYARIVAGIVVRAAAAVNPPRLVCVVKTDVWFHGVQILVGFRIAEECVSRGLPLRCHWVWQKSRSFSPYSPSFANVFIFGDSTTVRSRSAGIISNAPSRRYKGYPSSFTPEIFRELLLVLSEPGAIVLDPFVGIGGVIEAAASIGRWSCGLELSKMQFRRAQKRLAQIPNVIFHEELTQHE